MTKAVQRSACVALAMALAAVAAPSLAQSIPEGQSCGGLLCDMGIFGHKTAPAAAAVTQPPAAAVPAATPAVGEPVPPRGFTRSARRAAAAKPRLAKAPPTKAPPPVAPSSATVPAKLAASRAARPRPVQLAPAATASATAAPTRPYQPPLIFQSIDPMLQY